MILKGAIGLYFDIIQQSTSSKGGKKNRKTQQNIFFINIFVFHTAKINVSRFI